MKYLAINKSSVNDYCRKVLIVYIINITYIFVDKLVDGFLGGVGGGGPFDLRFFSFKPISELCLIFIGFFKTLQYSNTIKQSYTFVYKKV